jgi:CRP-like cAMP-binding protein
MPMRFQPKISSVRNKSLRRLFRTRLGVEWGTYITKLKSGKRRGPAQEPGISSAPLSNRLLLGLPPEEFTLLSPELEAFSFRSRQRLHEPGSEVEFVFFPSEGTVSVVLELHDGRSLEVSMVGKEGCVGTAALLGMKSVQLGATVQVPGTGFRIRAEVIRDRLSATPILQMLLARRAVAENLQASQIAACTRFHRIEQRLARWLLVCRAKTGVERLPFTQEFLAEMLGAGRPSVTLAAGALQKAGVISYNRGTVRIESTSKLEAAACDCYRAILESETELGDC